MLKEHDPPKEPAKRKAERRWKNHDIRTRFKEEKQKPKIVEETPPDIGDILVNESQGSGKLSRFQRKFKKEIAAMIMGHNEITVSQYRAALARQKNGLLREKLRRLIAAQGEV